VPAPGGARPGVPFGKKERMIRQLLLTLDPDDDQSRAVGVTRSFAERGGIPVSLLRVEEWPLFGSTGTYGWTPPIRAGRLTAVREKVRGPGARMVRIASSESLTPYGIMELAREEPASLLILPYRQEDLWARLFNAHASQKILWDSPIPVLAVPEGRESSSGAVTRILFVHGGGEKAARGSRLATQIAQWFEAPVGLLRILPSRPPRPRGFAGWWFGEKERGARAAPPEDPSQDAALLSLFGKRGVVADSLGTAADPVGATSSWVRGNAVDLVVLADVPGDPPVAEVLAKHLLGSLRVPVLFCRERSVLDCPENLPRFRLRP